MDPLDPPLTYRLEHRRAGACAVLAREATYAAVVARVLPLAVELRNLGAEGELVVVEEAFGTDVARHPLWPPDVPFEAYHPRPESPDA